MRLQRAQQLTTPNACVRSVKGEEENTACLLLSPYKPSYAKKMLFFLVLFLFLYSISSYWHQWNLVLNSSQAHLFTFNITCWNYILLVIWYTLYKLLAQKTANKRSTGTLIHKNALKWKTIKILFSLFFITNMMGLFYLDGILLSPLTWKGLEQGKEKKKRKAVGLLEIFLYFKSFWYI